MVVGCASKRRNGPPPARAWTRGRWWWWDSCQKAKTTTSGSRLDAREVVVVGVALKRDINHLRLAFGREGGGGGGRDFGCRFVLVVRSVNQREWGDGR